MISGMFATILVVAVGVLSTIVLGALCDAIEATVVALSSRIDYVISC